MSVGLLLITHGDIAHALHKAAISVIGCSPLRTEIIPVHENDDPEAMISLAIQQTTQLDTGSGVLVLTDMYGSTPSNIACALKQHHVAILSGLNLPMLIRVMNYPTATLAELADKAINAGTDGIVQCSIEEPQHAAPGS
jgi:PTS system mannose-specific IIA component